MSPPPDKNPEETWNLSMSNDEAPWYGRPTHAPDGTPYLPPMGRFDPVYGEIALSGPPQLCVLGMDGDDGGED